MVSVVAMNEFGTSKAANETFRPSNDPEPPAPLELATSKVFSREIHVTWLQPVSSAKVGHYTVRYREWLSSDPENSEPLYKEIRR